MRKSTFPKECGSSAVSLPDRDGINLFSQQPKLGAPFKPFFWLEWDTTALDRLV